MQCLSGIAALPFQVLLEGRRINPLVHFHVKLRTEPDQHEAADKLQRGHEQIGAQYHHRQHHQCGLIAARQNAVVHLQHIQGRHQHDHVNDGAKNTDGPERPLEADQGLRNFIFRNLEFGHYLEQSAHKRCVIHNRQRHDKSKS